VHWVRTPVSPTVSDSSLVSPVFYIRMRPSTAIGHEQLGHSSEVTLEFTAKEGESLSSSPRLGAMTEQNRTWPLSKITEQCWRNVLNWQAISPHQEAKKQLGNT
jgi:hypothetical protein